MGDWHWILPPLHFILERHGSKAAQWPPVTRLQLSAEWILRIPGQRCHERIDVPQTNLSPTQTTTPVYIVYLFLFYKKLSGEIEDLYSWTWGLSCWTAKEKAWRRHGKMIWAGEHRKPSHCIHIRTNVKVWNGSAVLCNSTVKFWHKRHHGFKPVEPHYPKIYQPYSQGNAHLCGVLQNAKGGNFFYNGYGAWKSQCRWQKV